MPFRCLSSSVSVINGATNKVITNITVGSGPVAVAFDSANGYIYVANCESGTVSIISTPGVSGAQLYRVTFNYLLIVIIIVIVAIIAVLASVLVMRRGKKKGGPKQWQEPPKEKPEDEKK